MLVKDLMSNNICCVKEDTSLVQVARKMKQEDIGLVPVCNDKEEVLGLITDRDIVIRALTDESKIDALCARDIMTTNLIFTSPNMNSHQAALLLAKYQVRRLPVVENSRLVGMLSMADIARKTAYIDEAGDALSAISQISTMQ